MALALEEEFGVKFTNDDFPNIKTVKDVVDLILEETSYNPISGRHHVENRYITLNRKDIATVRFNK